MKYGKHLKKTSSVKITKRAVIASAVCTILCVLLLLSGTVAWFTAEKESGDNELYSGNLDVRLYYSKTMADGDWREVTEDTKDIFYVDGAPMRWEPGAVNVAYFKIENRGSLAAKYDFSVGIENEVPVPGKEGVKLSDYIKGGVVQNVSSAFSDRTAAVGALGTEQKLSAISGTTLINGEMNGGSESKTFALVLHMPSDTGDATNYRTPEGESPKRPKVPLKVKLVATQQNEESDSFGDTYDFNAKYPDGSSSPVMNVGSAESLKAAIAQFTGGSSIVLDKDIDLKNENWDTTAPWAASGTELVFDGNGHTIKNLKTTGDNGGLFGHLNSNGNITIKNLKIENVDLTGTNVDGESGGGALIGWSEVYGGTLTIENVTVTNVNIKDFKYIGGLVGYTSASNALNIKNCSVNGTELNCTYCEDENNYKGHVGGVIGYYTAGTMSDCSASNLTIKGSTTAKRAGALIGTAQAGAVVGSGNSINNVTINETSVTENTQVIGSVDYRTDKTTNVAIQQ